MIQNPTTSEAMIVVENSHAGLILDEAHHPIATSPSSSFPPPPNASIENSTPLPLTQPPQSVNRIRSQSTSSNANPRNTPNSNNNSDNVTKKYRFPLFQRLFFSSSISRQTSHSHNKAIHSKETINPLIKHPLTHYEYQFTDLPSELYHLILSYYAISFREIIHFSTINKTCKEIADCSLLWIQLKLQFYPSLQYLKLKSVFPKDYVPPAVGNGGRGGAGALGGGIEYQQEVDRRIETTFLPTLQKGLFEVELRYPPVYKIHLFDYQDELPLYYQAENELLFQTATRVRIWWMNLFVNYQRLFHWQVKWLPISQKIYDFVNSFTRQLHLIFLFALALGIASVALLFDCTTSNLSLLNQIGIAFLLSILGIGLLCTLLYALSAVAESMIYNSDSLRFQLKYTYLFGLDMIGSALLGMFLTILFVLCKLINIIDDGTMSWWMTTLPLCFSFSISFAIGCRKALADIYFDCWDCVLLFMGFYNACAIPLSSLLIGCYYDGIYTGDFSYTLIPLYPYFLAVMMGLLFRLFYTIVLFHDAMRNGWWENCWNGQNSREDIMNGILYACIINCTNFATIMSSWFVLILLIDSFWMNNDNWDKVLFGVHFTPLTCALLFVLSFPCILFGLFLEDLFNY